MEIKNAYNKKFSTLALADQSQKIESTLMKLGQLQVVWTKNWMENRYMATLLGLREIEIYIVSGSNGLKCTEMLPWLNRSVTTINVMFKHEDVI